MAPILPPHHTPLASPVDPVKNAVQDAVHELKEATPGAVRASVVVGFFALDLCPLSTPIADPPQQEQHDTRRVGRQATTWVSSATSQAHVPMPFNQFDWPVPQRRSSNAHLAMSSTNHALLFGDTPTTTQDSTGIFKANNA
jgi:hypothetical protein